MRFRVTMSVGLRGIFGKISFLYEVFNHLITAGLDSVWRRKAAHITSGVGSSIWMDVCCGTGNMATSLKRSIGSPGVGIAVDYSAAMLHRAFEKPELRRLLLVLADAKALPSRENVIDLVSIAFATRNLSISLRSLRQSLGEIHRILKPHGWFLNLETSQSRNKTITGCLSCTSVLCWES